MVFFTSPLCSQKNFFSFKPKYETYDSIILLRFSC